MKLVDLDTFIKLPKGTVYITIFPNKVNKDGIIIDSDCFFLFRSSCYK